MILLASGSQASADAGRGSISARKEAARRILSGTSASRAENDGGPNGGGQLSQQARQLLRRGAAYHRTGRLDESERLFREAIALDPRNADGYFNLGAMSEWRGDLVAALAHYRAAMNLAPEDAQIREAVSSVEARLARNIDVPESESETFSPFQHPQRAFSRGGDQANQDNFSELDGEQAASNTPILEQYNSSPPEMPVDGVFQLRSSQNSLVAGTTFRPDPAVNSGGLNPVSINVRQSRPRRASAAAFNTILNVGLSAALRGSGLHCPACRWLRF
jgi:tetratricopeptide (TPR) repeat protein